MKDLQNPRLIWLKGLLLLAIGTVSAILLWLQIATFRGALLLGLSIWGFCRAYYFAFYVLEKYVDPGFRFAGLGSFIFYVLRRRNRRNQGPSSGDEQKP
jgi:hypothetical protein